ncbi:MAG: hypothetical protein AMXMBFR47_35970 [Planctomycetota bacterium]
MFDTAAAARHDFLRGGDCLAGAPVRQTPPVRVAGRPGAFFAAAARPDAPVPPKPRHQGPSLAPFQNVSEFSEFEWIPFRVHG